MCFFSMPQVSKGKEFISITRIKNSSHRRDVVCIDTTTKNNIVTGSIDNVICFW